MSLLNYGFFECLGNKGIRIYFQIHTDVQLNNIVVSYLLEVKTYASKDITNKFLGIFCLLNILNI